MLLWLYDEPYASDREGLQKDADMLFHARVYAVADKYLIDDLKWEASNLFCWAASGHWDSRQFCQAIREGYYLPNITDENGIRASIDRVCLVRIEELIRRPEFVSALRETPELSATLLTQQMRRVNKVEGRKAYQRCWTVPSHCHTCKTPFSEEYGRQHSEEHSSRRDGRGNRIKAMRCPRGCNAMITDTKMDTDVFI